MPWPRDARYLQIGNLLIDLRYRRVSDAGNEVVLPQRIFDLLLLLLAEPHALHSRAELFERLWSGLVVEDANLSQSVWLLRKALGDARKDWIRTVAGSGYVFEPPGPVESFMERPESLASATSPDADGDSTVSVTPHDQPGEAPAAATPSDGGSHPKQHTGWRVWVGLGAAAALAIGLIFGNTWYGKRVDKPTPAAAAPLTIALIDVEDAASGQHWPVALLHDWLGWKLGSLPEVTLLTESELAAGTQAMQPTVMFLSSASDPRDPEQIVLRSRFQEAAGEQRIEVRGSVDEVPAMVDKLSRQIVERLRPGRAGPWPALRLDAVAARRYADLSVAMKQRDWIAAASLADEIVKRAPHFGLARLQQALARSALSQPVEAVDSMDKAMTLLQPAPADTIALLQAQRLAMNLDPQSQERALEAYAALAARHPDNSAIALTHATLLLQNVHIALALKALTSPRWEHEPTGVRIRHLVLLSRTYTALGDAQRALQSAQAAERLSEAAGKQWNLERGAAILQTALIDPALDEKRRVARIDQAAQLFEEAGNHTAALYARFRAEAARAPAPGQEQHLGTLLAQAHAGGYRSLELLILLVTADQAHSAGDIDRYRDYLMKAVTVAQTSGDTGRRDMLELAMVYEDLMRLRYTSADTRIGRLKRAGLEGHAASLLHRLEAALHTARGEHARSRDILTQGERQLAALQPDEDRVTQAQAELACAKGENDLALGDLSGARADGKRCGTSADPNTSTQAKALDAYTKLLAGDLPAAREQLPHVRTALLAVPDGPDRWGHAMMLAALLTRAGDYAGSDALYRELLPKLRASGYQALIVQAETGMAENAAARGDWREAPLHVAAARGDLPTDDWSLRYRLDVIDAAVALAKGDPMRATSALAETHARAHRLGDVVAQIELHSLMPGAFPECTLAFREAVIARSGMRGAKLSWLTAGLPGDPVSQ
ncbi:winged helix-turn-helix domain-containing protein [Lysobacter tyrosinilyticus]